MKSNCSDNLSATTFATAATNWVEMRRPQNYEEAVEVASQLITARLNPHPKAQWRIRIDRPENGPPRIWLSKGFEGTTRAEYFARLKEGKQEGTIEERAMASRLLYREQTTPHGKGRPTREQAALNNPAGQCKDLVVYETCMMLGVLGWVPLARSPDPSRKNPLKEHNSTFDAVADAFKKRENNPLPRSYSGVRDAYYRVSEKMLNL